MKRMSIFASAILAAASVATASFGQANFGQTNFGQANPDQANADQTNPGDAKPLDANGEPSRGPVVDDLVANGFEVVRDTSVVGDFDGCEQDRQVMLKMGVFTCAGFGYMHAHNPKAVLLKKKDATQFKLVIDNAVFDGAFTYG